MAVNNVQKKMSPTYDLVKVKSAVARLKTRAFTSSSIDCIEKLQISPEDAIDVILGLDGDDFYKTMSAKKDPGHYQDVYHSEVNNVELYIKFTLYCDRPVVISFKEK